MAVINPFPYYSAFTYTPTVPTLYWDVYSQEERIKALCCEYDKLIHFVDAQVDTINAQYQTIQSLQSQLASLVNEDTVEYLDENLADETSTLYTMVSANLSAWQNERTAQVDANTAAIADIETGTTYSQFDTNGFTYREV